MEWTLKLVYIQYCTFEKCDLTAVRECCNSTIKKSQYMKAAVLLTSVLYLGACSVEREVQVEMVDAKLVKVDTLFRAPNYIKLLTWEGSDRVQYVSYASITETFPLGAKMRVFVKR
jgi:hypothetical protein